MTTPLIEAIFTENIEEALRLIEAKDRINQALKSGKTPLHLAAERGHVEIVEALLKNGANPKLTDADGQTPLVLAEENNHAAIVALLRPLTTTKKNDVHNIESSKMLINAAKEGSLEKTRAALAARADVNYANEHGDTALIWACQKGHIEVVRSLLNAGANANLTSKNSAAPLLSASVGGHTEIACLLLDAGASANLTNKNGSRPLTLAAAHGHTAIVNLLLDPKHEIDINYVNPTSGKTSLISAVIHKHLNVVRLLLAKNALLDMQDKEGKTALMWACERGDLQTIEALLEKGANPNIADKNGETLLYKAVKNGHADMVNALLKNGADVNTPFKEEHSLLHLAAMQPKPAIIETILKHLVYQNSDHDSLINTLNNGVPTGTGKDTSLPGSRNKIRELFIETLKEKIDAIIDSGNLDKIQAEIPGLRNIKAQVRMLQKESGLIKKEKSSMRAVNAMITALDVKRMQLENSMDASPANAAICLTVADGLDRNHLASYLLKTKMTPNQSDDLLKALKELNTDQFYHLKQQLKDFVLLTKEQAYVAEQTMLRKLFSLKNNEVYNANPFLFILRTGTSKYEQKDTDSFNEARNEIMGSALMNALGNLGLLGRKKPKALSQDEALNREDPNYRL